MVNRTALTTAMIFFIFVGATTFSYIFRAVYGEDLIIEFIEFLDLHTWALLFLLMLVVFLLGFFFDWLEITLIVLPVFAPVVKAMSGAFAAHLGMEGAFHFDIEAEHDLLVRHPGGDQPADILPDPTLRIRAVLHEGRGPTGSEDAGHLFGDHSLRGPAADRTCGWS